ncbi:hypothetical protein KUTeg_020172 [Tegillarca granosa]|uniref:CARD domain-containing protein n=1 Tax=Tegillarca granosa TaxID=220873 RepID=A0ABQ9ECK1_TEGGR|nr:hypothetical protein KUTeg_020172 [Tegillarca granosa]
MEKVYRNNKGKVIGKIKVSEKGIHNKIKANLVSKPDIITGNHELCWSVHRSVKGLIDGEHSDYILKSAKKRRALKTLAILISIAEFSLFTSLMTHSKGGQGCLKNITYNFKNMKFPIVNHFVLKITKNRSFTAYSLAIFYTNVNYSDYMLISRLNCNPKMDETTKKAVSTMVHLFNAIDDKIDTITAELHNKIDGVYSRLDETENVISIIKSEVERQRKVENKPRLLRKRAVEYKFDKESSSSDGSLFYPIMNVTGSTLTEFNAHQEVLVENHELLMSNLDLSVTNVLDEMVTNDAISNSDAEFVRSQPKIKDKTRQLLLLIACYGSSCFNKFIECLKKEYPFLFDKLNKEFGDLLNVEMLNKHGIKSYTTLTNPRKENKGSVRHWRPNTKT